MAGSSWFVLLTLSLAVAAASITVTRAAVTKPLREWVDSKGWTFVHKLLTCPYCMSHWFAALAALYGSSTFLSWLVLTFAIVALSAIITGLIFKLFLIQEAEIERLYEEIEALEGEQDEQ